MTLDIYEKHLLQDKVAFVTGGGSGICRGMTECLMRHGCDTVIVSRTLAKLEKAALELELKTGRQCLSVAADVRNPQEMMKAVEKALEKFKKIDILICGAAGNFLAPFENLSYRAFKTVVDIDLVGTFNTIKACFKALVESKGCIINVTATLQYTGIPLQAHAASAKAGVDALTRVLAGEFGRYGIRVNAIAPGPIQGTEGVMRLVPLEMMKDYIETIPLKRMGKVQDIESATIYLASKAASYVTGSILVVDGGSWTNQNAIMLKGMKSNL